ncbi:MAG: TolC family protein [Elusimicrobiota bacterium]
MSRLVAVLLCASSAAFAAGDPSGPAVETYTLEDAVRAASRNNPALQSAQKNIAIAEQRVREAQLRFLPEVGLQATATRFKSNAPFALRPDFRSILLFPSDHRSFYAGQAYMNLALYEGRRAVNTLKLAKQALKQTNSQFEAVKLDTVFEAKKVYYRFILAQEVLRATEELAAAVRAVGPKAEDDSWLRLEAESLTAELRAEGSAAGHELDLARLAFLKTLGREFDTPVRVDGALASQPVQADLRQALVWATELRPELQSQIYKTQMDAIAVNLALGRRYPTLVLGMDCELTDQDFPLRKNNWDATVGVRLPFAFDFWTQHGQRVAEQRQAEIALAELNDTVQLEVRSAHKDLLFWQEEWPKREGEHRRMRELFESALRERSGRDALRAASRVLAAQKRFLQAVVEHILARARLERAVGREFPAGG